ncbi:MAG: universal stress protein [Bacteroidota bacterium]
MHKILVPTDFSPASQVALAYGQQLASQMEAELVVFHAYHYTQGDAMFAPTEVLAELNSEPREAAVRLLAALTEEFYQGKHLKVKQVVQEGFADELILEIAKEEEPTFIIMGTHGIGGIAAKLLGSVTTTVMLHGQFPVIAVPPEYEPHPVGDIVFATDLVSRPVKAMHQLAIWSRLLGASLRAMHVKVPNQPEAVSLQEDETYLAGMEFDKIPLDVIAAPTVAKGLQQVVDNQLVDLLAVLPHEHPFWEGLFHQSVTKYLSQHARIPILCLRDQ